MYGFQSEESQTEGEEAKMHEEEQYWDMGSSCLNHLVEQTPAQA